MKAFLRRFVVLCPSSQHIWLEPHQLKQGEKACWRKWSILYFEWIWIKMSYLKSKCEIYVRHNTVTSRNSVVLITIFSTTNSLTPLLREIFPKSTLCRPKNLNVGGEPLQNRSKYGFIILSMNLSKLLQEGMFYLILRKSVEKCVLYVHILSI